MHISTSGLTFILFLIPVYMIITVSRFLIIYVTITLYLSHYNLHQQRILKNLDKVPSCYSLFSLFLWMTDPGFAKRHVTCAKSGYYKNYNRN